jgi:hypothetical protein
MTNPAKILSPREMPSVKQIHFAFGAASHALRRSLEVRFVLPRRWRKAASKRRP